MSETPSFRLRAFYAVIFLLLFFAANLHGTPINSSVLEQLRSGLSQNASLADAHVVSPSASAHRPAAF